MTQVPQQERPAGRRVPAFCQATGIGRTTLYGLPAELQPESVLIGACRVIIEDPSAWLTRLAKSQATRAA